MLTISNSSGNWNSANATNRLNTPHDPMSTAAVDMDHSRAHSVEPTNDTTSPDVANVASVSTHGKWISRKPSPPPRMSKSPPVVSRSQTPLAESNRAPTNQKKTKDSDHTSDKELAATAAAQELLIREIRSQLPSFTKIPPSAVSTASNSNPSPASLPVPPMPAVTLDAQATSAPAPQNSEVPSRPQSTPLRLPTSLGNTLQQTSNPIPLPKKPQAAIDFARATEPKGKVRSVPMAPLSKPKRPQSVEPVNRHGSGMGSNAVAPAANSERISNAATLLADHRDVISTPVNQVTERTLTPKLSAPNGMNQLASQASTKPAPSYSTQSQAPEKPLATTGARVEDHAKEHNLGEVEAVTGSGTEAQRLIRIGLLESERLAREEQEAQLRFERENQSQMESEARKESERHHRAKSVEQTLGADAAPKLGESGSSIPSSADLAETLHSPPLIPNTSSASTSWSRSQWTNEALRQALYGSKAPERPTHIDKADMRHIRHHLPPNPAANRPTQIKRKRGSDEAGQEETANLPLSSDGSLNMPTLDKEPENLVISSSSSVQHHTASTSVPEEQSKDAGPSRSSSPDLIVVGHKPHKRPRFQLISSNDDQNQSPQSEAAGSNSTQRPSAGSRLGEERVDDPVNTGSRETDLSKASEPKSLDSNRPPSNNVSFQPESKSCSLHEDQATHLTRTSLSDGSLRAMDLTDLVTTLGKMDLPPLHTLKPETRVKASTPCPTHEAPAMAGIWLPREPVGGGIPTIVVQKTIRRALFRPNLSTTPQVEHRLLLPNHPAPAPVAFTMPDFTCNDSSQPQTSPLQPLNIKMRDGTVCNCQICQQARKQGQDALRRLTNRDTFHHNPSQDLLKSQENTTPVVDPASQPKRQADSTRTSRSLPLSSDADKMHPMPASIEGQQSSAGLPNPANTVRVGTTGPLHRPFSSSQEPKTSAQQSMSSNNFDYNVQRPTVTGTPLLQPGTSQASQGVLCPHNLSSSIASGLGTQQHTLQSSTDPPGPSSRSVTSTPTVDDWQHSQTQASRAGAEMSTDSELMEMPPLFARPKESRRGQSAMRNLIAGMAWYDVCRMLACQDDPLADISSTVPERNSTK